MSLGRLYSLSLKSRITLLTLAAFLLGVWSVAFYATQRLQRDMLGLLGTQQFSAVSTVAKQIDSELKARLEALDRVAGEIPVALLGKPAELQQYIAIRTNLIALFNGGLRIRDTNADALAQIPTETVRANVADRDYMIAALKEGRTTIGKPVVSRSTGAAVIPMAAPIRDASGQVVGAVVGIVDLGNANFLDSVTGSRLGQTGGYLIIAPQHGLIVTGTDKSRIMAPMPPPGVNRNHDRFVAGYEGYGIAVNSRGIEELAAARQIPAAGWFLVGVLPTGEALAPIHATQQHVVGAAALLSLLVGMVAWVFVRRLLRHQFAPMLAATQAMSGMAQPVGARLQTLPVAHNDEVGQLIDSFNRLIESVKCNEEALKQQQEHLEERVLERTVELTEAKVAAEAANRAKSAFLANMSHELRTPLHGIMGMLALIRRRTTDPAVLEKINKAKGAADHLLTVLNDILDLSKIEADRMVLETGPLQLRDVLDNLAAIVGHKAIDKGLGFTLDIPDDLAVLPLNGDPLRLGQIVINLAGNSVKFTERGSITVRVRLAADSGCTVLVRFEIVDTGIGISPEAQARLFSAFEQADNSMTRKYGGTGLGLAISKRLATMMEGEIGVDSVPGQGSTFWFTVRLEKRLVDAVASAPSSINGSEERLRRDYPAAGILLVEDEPTNREVALELLAEVGLQVTVAVDGVQAVEATRRQRFALILMDMQMPNLNGLDATRAIRSDALNQATPILAMTANALDEDCQRCLDAGMNAHLAKPIGPDTLYAAILHWLDATRNIAAV